MATIGLNQWKIQEILGQVEDIMIKNRGTLPSYPSKAPDGVGDEAFSLVLPESNEQQIKALLPGWAMPMTGGMYVHVKHPDDPNGWRIYTPNVFAPFRQPRLRLGMDKMTSVFSAKGIEELTFDGLNMGIKPATDGTVIDEPNLREFVENMLDVQDAHFSAQKEVNKAVDDMSKFLKGHRTLQKAVKEFGPALLEFVPPHMKTAYNEAPKQKEKKPKPEPFTFDKDYLIAAATASKLNLN